MKIKAVVLEKLINDSIGDLERGFHDNEFFTIHSEDGIQVQILITQDQGEFMEEILPEYAKAD